MSLYIPTHLSEPSSSDQTYKFKIIRLIPDRYMVLNFLNFSTPELNLTLTFQPLSMFKWQMYSAQQLRNRFNVLGNIMGEEEDDQDQDSVKEAFLETNIYLLVLTFVVSIVHSIFEFLAFKNDIQFWNKK